MRNTGWLLFEQIFRMALSLVVTSLMARFLGTEDFGLLNYSLAYVMIFTAVSNLGIDSILVNEIIKNKVEAGKVIGSTIVLRLISSVSSIFLIYLIVKYLNPNDFTLYTLTILQSISLIFTVFDSIQYWFQANLQSKYIVISKSIAFSIVSFWRLSLILFEKSISYFAIATVIEAIVMSIFIVSYFKRFKGPKLQFSLETAKQLLIKGFYHFIAALLIMAYTQIDKIMLGKMAGGTTVGVYTAAMTISSLWMFIPLALINSARPVIMEAKTQNEDTYLLKNKQLYCSIIWLGIIAAVVISLLAKPIILLIYGEQFIESTKILVILIWSRIFALVGTVKAIWLTVESLARYQVYFVGIGAFLSIILNLIFIPRYGAMGAAIAILVAEALSTIVACLVFKQTQPLFKLILHAFLFKGVKNRT
ncbi:flippase [Lysinibacillus yapensis]|uniref:Flippase n=1 Tax=Ureibacillus yapensis TaxID=2304605 RepID=A0A396SDX8_9BACL|nr:flippase [Lysinibacillus yapensis]RHW39524.1 flippase [Lysinibacillus yapensis]